MFSSSTLSNSNSRKKITIFLLAYHFECVPTGVENHRQAARQAEVDKKRENSYWFNHSHLNKRRSPLFLFSLPFRSDKEKNSKKEYATNKASAAPLSSLSSSSSHSSGIVFPFSAFIMSCYHHNRPAVAKKPYQHKTREISTIESVSILAGKLTYPTPPLHPWTPPHLINIILLVFFQ